MAADRPEEDELRLVALRNSTTILLAREQTEKALRQARDTLEVRTLELTHSLSLMRATLEATADGILVTDSEARVAVFNDACLKLWGLTAKAIQGLAYSKVAEMLSLQCSEPEPLAQLSPALLASPAAEPWTATRMTDGRVVEISSHPQQLDGKVLGRVWSYRDITHRKAAEDAFREEARVLDLLNRTGIAIASTLDLATLLQKVTDAATEMSGAEMGAFFYSTTDAAGDSFRLYTLSGVQREMFERFGEPRATPLFGPTFNGEPPVRCDDVLTDPRYGHWSPHRGMPEGHPAVRSYLAVPVASRGGQPVGGLFFGHSGVGVFTERIERMVVGIAAQAAVAIDNARLLEETQRTAQERERRLEAEQSARIEIARVSQLKDEFLATLSHELRTPLTAILGWSRLLLRPDAGSQLLGRGLETIERNAVAQARLIEDLLDMNRIISGKVRLNVQPTDLTRIIEAAVDSIRPSADGKDLSVSLRLPPTQPIVADPDRLQQVVWNLLSNAAKFTQRGGRIEVALTQLHSHVEITVSDSGIGLPPEFLPHVFDRFRQVDSSTTRSFGGLGLGLSIVKQLVEMHGGSVRAESEGENLGAAFVVSLPTMANLPRQEDEDPERQATRENAPAGIDLEGLSILVVDDEDDTRDLIRHVLSLCKAEVHTASSAAEGLSALQRLRPDLVVSDIGMPGRDGYEFLMDVRKLEAHHGGKTPAVALTAYARSEDRARVALAGYQVHISKPIDLENFLTAIARLAGRLV